jgi:hypothetical protein
LIVVNTLRADDAGSIRQPAAAAPAIVLTTPPSTTQSDEVDLKGRTSPKARVNAEGGAKAVQIRADAEGRFSIEVPLQRDRVNQLTLYAMSEQGVRGAPVSVAIRQDNTGPKVAVVVTPPANRYGWNNSPVTIHFTCTDAGGVASCPAPIKVVTEGQDQRIEATAVDAAGNREKIKVRVSIDATAPTAQLTLSPPPNAAGWNRGNVTVRFKCDDAGGAGIARCPDPVIVSGEGAALVASGTVVDKADNSATASTTVHIDRSAPIINVESPSDGRLVYASPVQLTGRVSDSGSGVATVNCGSSAAVVSGGAFECAVPLEMGRHRIQVWAADRAGNVASARQHLVLGPKLPAGDAHEVRVTADLSGDGRADLVRTDFLSGEAVMFAAYAGDSGYRPERRVAVGAYPSSIALSDLNGDGIVDLITTHYTTGEVHIQYGRRDGTFVAGPHIEVGAFPSAVIVADVNGDGRADILTTHMSSGSVHVQLAQADGTYTAGSHIRVGDGPVAAAISDVNGDGILDIVTANFVSGDISLLLGKGAGQYRSERRIALGSGVGPAAIALVDVNSDGILDIVTANFNADSVSVVPGSGQGEFQPAQSFGTGHQPIALIVRDLSGDGRLDLITYNAGSGDYSLLAALPGGGFGSPQQLATPSAPAPIVTPRPLVASVSIAPAVASDTVVAAAASGVFATPARVPVPGLLPPSDRVGLTFGGDTSDYGQLFGPNGMSYPPLVAAGRAGMKWLRVDANRPDFVSGTRNVADYAAFVDRLIAAGFSAHIIVTDMRWWPKGGVPYPDDFPTDTYLEEYAQFAGQLAAATQRPGRVIFEVWNEADALGLFWHPQRAGKNEAALFAKMLTKVTEAIHTAAPDAIVISGGFTSSSAAYVDQFLPQYNQMIAGRPKAQVDRFGFHPYAQNSDTLLKFRRQLDAAGLQAYPIDITEIGDWYGEREWVARRNAAILLRATENDIPHTNFWAAISPTDKDFKTAGFMDPAPAEGSVCSGSVFADIPGISAFHCHPNMYVVSTFDRVARGRSYQGAYVDARSVPLPGAATGDDLSGLRLLKFETDEDVVVAAYTLDWARPDVPGSGRSYRVTFGETPIYTSSDDGKQINWASSNNAYDISYARGPAYFFFSKSGQPPTPSVNARAVCADGSIPLRGRVQYWHTPWPTAAPPQEPLPWQSPGAGDAPVPVSFTRALPLFSSNLYVAAEIADNTSVFLPLRSASQVSGGALAATVTGGTFFQPLTNMARINGPMTTTGKFQLDFLAPAEWCTP